MGENISLESPNQVEHIDLFSFRKKKKKLKKKDWARTRTSKPFSNISAPLPSYFPCGVKRSLSKVKVSEVLCYLHDSPNRSLWGSKGELLSSNFHLQTFHSCTFSVISTAVTMQITHSAGLLIGSTDASSSLNGNAKSARRETEYELMSSVCMETLQILMCFFNYYRNGCAAPLFIF